MVEKKFERYIYLLSTKLRNTLRLLKRVIFTTRLLPTLSETGQKIGSWIKVLIMFQVYINTYTHFKINEKERKESPGNFLYSLTRQHTNNSFALETLNLHDVGTFFPTKYSFPIINIFGQNTIGYRAGALNNQAHYLIGRYIYIGCILIAMI